MSTLMVAGGGGPLGGSVRVPGDKSISHRALMVGALAEGTSVVRGLSGGDDVARTRRAVELLGASVDGERITGGVQGRTGSVVIDVGNSGTTIRLLAGICAWLDRPDWIELSGDASVRRRPMSRVVDPLRLMGARVQSGEGCLAPLRFLPAATLRPIDYLVPVPSAQVKSAVLLAGLGAAGQTVVRESVRTRMHTEELLALAGADLEVDAPSLTARIRPGPLRPFDYDVPGDPSQAAFWFVAAAIVPGSEIELSGLYAGPARTGFVDVLERMGASVTGAGEGGFVVRHAGRLRATVVEAAEIPGLDEVPVLAVAAALAEGTTTFRSVGELRVKESDRLATMAEGLGAMGAEVSVAGTDLVVAGSAGRLLRGAHVRSHGDHRVAMALAVAALAAEGETVIDGWDAVATSYPGFAEALASCRS